MNFILTAVFVTVFVSGGWKSVLNVAAVQDTSAVMTVETQDDTALSNSIKNVQDQIQDTQNQIDSINNKIDSLVDEQAIVDEKIADLNAEVINTMTSIDMKEEELTEKEEEIEQKERSLREMQGKIEEAEAAYEEARLRQEKQYNDMLVRIRYMYETGNTTMLGMVLQGNGLADLLNRMDYVERVYEYDRDKLQEFEDTRIQVQELWDSLVAEKSVMEVEKAELEAGRQKLEEDKKYLESQKANLSSMLSQMKAQSANYEAEIQKAKQEAAVAAKLLKQEQQQLKKLQDEKNKPKPGSNTSGSQSGGTATGSGNTSTPTVSAGTTPNVIYSSAGSDLGKQIAAYACQYVGNPYVAGGTSLTSGADCSGFTYRVYSDFGYKLPRTSYEQRSAGVAVDYANAQPGDIICYEGHVALYIGGGQIVHASTVKTGIKYGTATYRPILAVRRII